MTVLLRLVAGLFGLSLLLFPLFALSNSTGAPAARTGAPNASGGNEATCAAVGCHNSFELNSGPGQLRVEAPQTYTPGEVIEFKVQINQDGKPIFGFEVAAKDGNGRHVGDLLLADMTNTQYASSISDDYVTHTIVGLQRNEWTVRWRAPQTAAGPVTFYAAGNAANGNGATTGDHIYTTSHTLEVKSDVGVQAEAPAEAFTHHDAYPNPFEGATTIRYELAAPMPVTVTVYDALGRVVRVLHEGTQAAGFYEHAFEAPTLAPGLYLYELRTPDARVTRTLIRF